MGIASGPGSQFWIGDVDLAVVDDAGFLQKQGPSTSRGHRRFGSAVYGRSDRPLNAADPAISPGDAAGRQFSFGDCSPHAALSVERGLPPDADARKNRA